MSVYSVSGIVLGTQNSKMIRPLLFGKLTGTYEDPEKHMLKLVPCYLI